MPEKYYRFNLLADRIRQLVKILGLEGEVEIDEDQYNNTIKLYYETTEWWDSEKETWSNEWDED